MSSLFLENRQVDHVSLDTGTVSQLILWSLTSNWWSITVYFVNSVDGRWDEMGYYDIPATINYILATTGWPKLSYVGHSLGCGVFFIAMATHPKLNAKVGWIRLVLCALPSYSISQKKISYQPNVTFHILSQLFAAPAWPGHLTTSYSTLKFHNFYRVFSQVDRWLLSTVIKRLGAFFKHSISLKKPNPFVSEWGLNYLLNFWSRCCAHTYLIVYCSWSKFSLAFATKCRQMHNEA